MELHAWELGMSLHGDSRRTHLVGKAGAALPLGRMLGARCIAAESLAPLILGQRSFGW